MIHAHKDDFVRLIQNVASKTGFLLPVIEKDYYLTLLLTHMSELSPDLVFKGGTCLNKIYFSYYRLSEDLDFSMVLPRASVSRETRRRCIKPIKEKIVKFAKQLDLRIEDLKGVGHNESKQYVFIFIYKSVILPIESKIKLEIGLRYSPINDPVPMSIQHKFLHPFSGKPLFETEKVSCLCLKELVAEKLRAAAFRMNIAPRDFFDIDFILKSGFSVNDSEFLSLFQKKMGEDSIKKDLYGLRVNLGRSEKDIQEMKARIKEELFDVLTMKDRQNFDTDLVLNRINAKFCNFG